MDELKIRIQKYLIELYKWKNKMPKSEKRIIVRYADGKIEALENVLEFIEEIEKGSEK